MKLITAANPRYFERIRPYLQSLSECKQPATLLCVSVGGELLPNPPNGIDVIPFSRALNYGAPDETESPQHGAFLQKIKGPDDEILIFTDGDIVMQRPFCPDELRLLDGLGENEIAAGYNSGPNETLAVEAARLFPKHPLPAIGWSLGEFDKPCFNIGVIAARRGTWQRIYDFYVEMWGEICKAFGHPARQQWLVNWCAHRLGMRFVLTPYSLHANGHYGVPPGVTLYDGRAYYGADRKLVCLRHKL